MTLTPGPIPLKVTRHYCQADDKMCQRLSPDGIHFYCTGGDIRHVVTSFWTAQNRLPAPAWCPLRGPSDE